MHRRKVLVLGDTNIDLVMRDVKRLPKMGQEVFIDDMTFCVGGSAANVAIGLAKLETETYIYTILSDDLFSEYILDYFKEVNLSDKFVQIAEGYRAGLSVGLTHNKDRSFISYMGTNELFGSYAFDEKWLKEFNHLHFSGYNLNKCLKFYLDIAKKGKKSGCTLSFDLGWTDFENHREDLTELLTYMDIFFPNTHEAKHLSGKDDLDGMFKELSRYVKGTIVITAGEEGAYAYDHGKVFHKVFKVNAIDAIGAGDAFDAGFLSAYLNKKDIETCLEYGCACGAIAVSSSGGSLSSPTKKELVTFLEQSHKNGFDINH